MIKHYIIDYLSVVVLYVFVCILKYVVFICKEYLLRDICGVQRQHIERLLFVSRVN